MASSSYSAVAAASGAVDGGSASLLRGGFSGVVECSAVERVSPVNNVVCGCG